MLRRLGFWAVVAHSHRGGTRRTSAARWSSAPTRGRRCSIPWCRSHDVENLFVVDASFFPSSAAVNPALD
jgi:choline dehydrogenase-like flavoprotein